MGRYLEVPELKDYTQSTLKGSDSLYEDAIGTAEGLLDNACGRRFELAATVATARVYIPTGTEVLDFHDCTEIASVVSNGSTLVSGVDFQAEPLNGLSDGGEPCPFYMLRRISGYWNLLPATTWDVLGATKRATITITAKWGWPLIPSGVKESCKIVAKDVFNQRATLGFGLVDISTAGGVGSRENSIVRKTVAFYSHPKSIGVG